MKKEKFKIIRNEGKIGMTVYDVFSNPIEIAPGHSARVQTWSPKLSAPLEHLEELRKEIRERELVDKKELKGIESNRKALELLLDELMELWKALEKKKDKVNLIERVKRLL